jgi:predicted amidohydrolase YtcJ
MSSIYKEKIGSIEVGKYADMIIVDTPVLEKTPDEIMKTKVLATYLAGEKVYPRK